jgi:adenylate kinase family enzyme
MKILIFGASGSGTTTLADFLSQKTSFPHLEVDSFYWKSTNPPFQEKVNKAVRQKNLLLNFKKYNDVIICGSMVSWGKIWETAFDLVVFIYLENETRMQRLKKREFDRYGDQLFTDKQIQQNSEAFLEWANKYENPNFSGRSLNIHEEWIKKIDCPILRLNGLDPLADKINSIIEYLKKSD